MSETREECYFLINGEECPNIRDIDHPFCPEHRAVFASLDNPALLDLAARNNREMMYVSKEKKLTAKADRELIDECINILHELYGRGYSETEASEAVARVIQETGVMDDLYKEMGRDPKWKKFEKIVAGIHILKSEGAEVKFDDHIIGKRTGRNRQIDISIRFNQAFYDYLAVIECKDYGSRVPMEKVEAFRTKLEDVGAMHGIMVSPHGFQEGAIATAKAYNIELFTLTEVKSDWTKKIKADVLTLPYPSKVEYDYPYFDLDGIYDNPHHIEAGEGLFYKDQHSQPIALYELMGNMAKWIVEQKLSLPCTVEVPFEPPLLTRFPRMNFYTPIYSLTVTFEPSKFAFGYEIDMPPKPIKYVYSDIDKERVHEVPANDVPKVD